MWFLYIIIGIILLVIAVKSGFISEFILLIVAMLICGGIGALLSWLIADSSIGFKIGIITGTVLYGGYCVLRIVNPDEYTQIDCFSDGSTSERHVSERGRGIVGLIVLIAAIILSFID